MKDFLKVVVYGALFAVPLVTLYVANDYFFPYITGKNFAFRILVEIAFVAWGVLCLLDAKYRPRLSGVFLSLGAVIIVMFFANLLGEHPQSSFWSNFERMDGYVTLVHVFLYMVVLSNILRDKKIWGYYLKTTLVVAFITALYGIGQYQGLIGERVVGRIESYLGNAAYFSIYMLFHIFLALWMLVESKVRKHQIWYGILALIFTYALINSGTRGTVLGLGVGLGVMTSYIVLFGAKYRELRQYAIGILVLLIMGAGALVIAKDSSFVQNSPNLARVANIDLGNDLRVRGTIWGMAWEGVKERPLLGWGQSNFNYVFNAKYDPFLYDQEQWFDRTHNIFFDWLIAGGFLGLIAYLSVWLSCLYYLIVQPLLKKDKENFTVLERGVLLGTLAGYFVHNLVVFDNIISYVFFAVILALIHSRVATPIISVEKFKLDSRITKQFLTPIAVILLVAVIYTVNIPAMKAAGDIIDGYRAVTPADKLVAFKRASSRESFAKQEVAEQVAQQAMTIIQDEKVPVEMKEEFARFAESELLSLAQDKPGDARVHVFLGNFYRAIGNLDEAAKHMAIARELSPLKPSLIAQQAIIEYARGDVVSARDMFKEAFDLDTRNDVAREHYAAMLFLNGEAEVAKALAENEEILREFARNDFLVSAVNEAGEVAFLTQLYEIRIEIAPLVEQNWVSLAFLQYRTGEIAPAVSTLRESGKVIPTFAPVANCLADNIEAGRDPQLGC